MQPSNEYSTWDNIMQLCLNMYEDNHDYLKYCLKLSKAVKKSAQRLLIQNQDVRFEDLYWQALKFEAPHLFDSYLLYLERKRLEQDRFYLPKRKQLNAHGLIQAMQDLEDDKLDILSISMPPGTQKCQPLYSKILTPTGFITMGDVKVGTKVISGTGNVATVLSISPRKKRKMYEVTFDDGSKTRCSDNHLCLYKNEPIEREGLLYTDEELRRFITLPITEPDAVWGICDTKNKGTDFLFLPCLLQYGNDFYLTECVCDDNSNYGIQYERTSDLIVNTGMQQCQFESNNGGDRVALEVSKLVEEKGGRCNITTKYTESNKETKIIVNADWVKKHVLFKDREQYKPKEDYGKMMGFLLSYSVRGKNPHDDVPDGLASFALFVTTGFVRPAEIYSSPV